MSSKSKRRRRVAVERVYSLPEFARLNNIADRTLLRLIRRGEGPRIMQVSPNRIGIRESEGAEWQASRVRSAADGEAA